MIQKQQIQYEVKVNGMPNYGKIPKATLEPIAKKFLADILNWLQEEPQKSYQGGNENED